MMGSKVVRKPESSGSSAIRLGFLEKSLLFLLGLDGLGVFVIWLIALTGGAFEQGLFQYQMEGTVPAFHLAAEFSMASVALVGVVGTWTRRWWGTGVLFFGLGMLGYSAVNSLGWALHNDVATAVPMIATVALILVAFPIMLTALRGSSAK